MCDTLPFIALLEEFLFIFDIHLPNKELFCKVFKYNQIFIAMSQSSRFLPHMKRFEIHYHCFRIFHKSIGLGV